MEVKIYRGIVMDSGTCETFTVKPGTSIVFLTKASERVFYARFIDDIGRVVEIPVDSLLEIGPA